MRTAHCTAAALLACLLSPACAVRQRAAPAWRLLQNGGSSYLMPPDVRKPEIQTRRIQTEVLRGNGACVSEPASPVTLRPRGRTVRMHVTRALEKQPRGWLTEWAFAQEENGCIATAEGSKLAQRALEAVPMELGSAFRVRYPDERLTGAIDLDANMYVRIVSPLLRDPGQRLLDESSTQVSASGTTLTITAKSANALIGYEEALYGPRRDGAGGLHRLVPLRADRHVDGKVERVDRPAKDPFAPLEPMRFHRILFKSSHNDFTALLLASHKYSDLALATVRIEREGMAPVCGREGGPVCAALAKEIAAQPLIAVSVQGAQVLVPAGSTIAQALRAAGHREPKSLLGRLAIARTWKGRLTGVSFDRNSEAILTLPLLGGEVLTLREP